MENSDVHYRLYLNHQDNQPCVICVQWFDYYDCETDRFLSEDRYESEDDAEAALNHLKNTKYIVSFRFRSTNQEIPGWWSKEMIKNYLHKHNDVYQILKIQILNPSDYL